MKKQMIALSLLAFAMVSYGNAQVIGWVDCGKFVFLLKIIYFLSFFSFAKNKIFLLLNRKHRYYPRT